MGQRGRPAVSCGQLAAAGVGRGGLALRRGFGGAFGIDWKRLGGKKGQMRL